MLLQAAQVASDYVSSPSVLADMVTAAGLSAWTINKLKQWKAVPWVNQNSDRINRAVSLAFALATTLGLHFAYHADPAGHHAGGILEIGLPSASEFIGTVWRTGGSYLMQQGAIRGFITHEEGLKAADAVADTIKDNKQQLAQVIERDSSVLKLREPDRLAAEVPVEFPWTAKGKL